MYKMSDHWVEIDAVGLLCPMPLIKLQNQMRKLPQGSLVKINCTDPGVLQDIPTWCRLKKYEVIKTSSNKIKEIKEINFLIRKTHAEYNS